MSFSIRDGSKSFRVVRLGRVNGDALRECLHSAATENLWHVNGAAMAAQQHTRSIPLREVRDEKGGADITPKSCAEFFEQQRVEELIWTQLETCGLQRNEYDIVDCILARLMPESKVYAHMDADYGTKQYAFWETIFRLHIPLVTNPDVSFIVAGKDFLDREAFVDAKGFKEEDNLHLEQDVLYQVNNLRFHAVENNSDEFRDHLIIDLRRK